MSVDHHVQQQFGAVAQTYVTSPVHARGADLPVLLRAAAVRPGELALDLGTAVGHTALAVAERGAWVVGVDLTPEMLAQATRLADERRLDNICFVRGTVQELPFPAESFDLVTSRYSAHHYSTPRRMAEEVRRVLRPGGRFVLADTVAPEDVALDTLINTVETLRDRSHVRDHTIAQWLTMIAAAGLVPSLAWEWDVELEFEDWVARMRTPAHAVTTLRALLTEASPEARQTFRIAHGEQLTFCLKVAIIRAVRPD